MTAPLPDSWADEPWPLDDPTPAPTLRPTNWSDTHDTVPQVADLADEAQELVDRHGWSMERALVHAQQRKAWTGGLSSAAVGSIAAAGAAGAVAGRTLGSAIRAAAEQEQQERARQAAQDFDNAMATLTDWLAGVDFDAMKAQLESMAEESRKPRIRWCPQHGQMAAGGYCRRCGR